MGGRATAGGFGSVIAQELERIMSFTRHSLLFRGILVALVGVLVSIHAGCTYRLPPFVPPSHEAVRIVAAAPDQYVLNVNTDTVTVLSVLQDGRVIVPIPAYRSCGVYLFNIVRVRQEDDLSNSWSITVTRNGKAIRKLSLPKLRALARDQDGYHLLKID